MRKPLNISEEAAVQMPMKTVASLIAMIAVGTWAYFGIHEKLNQHSTKIELMTQDLDQNTEFRIKWPRGQAGSLPADQEQYMMIEDLYKTTDRLNKHIDSMALNKVNIEFLQKQMDKVLVDIEKLKDADRDISIQEWTLTMIEAVIGLLMFVNGEIKEARLQPSMAICLRGKREAERTFSESVTYKCWKGKAELEDNIDGSKSIKKLIIE